jgi:PAS domain-containing protein
MKNTHNKSESEILRQKAEELLKLKSTRMVSQLSEIEILKLMHELDVHQIELEIQNDELNLANEQIKVAAEKYTELYEFAPIGYFTLSREGKIIELNHRGRLSII